MELKKIDMVEVEDIDWKDYPDFCDAFVSYAEYDGKPMTEEQLDELNDDPDLRYYFVEQAATP